MVTNYKLGQFKPDYEEYQKLKVMFQFINPDFSFINININAMSLYEANDSIINMKANFVLNTRSEPQPRSQALCFVRASETEVPSSTQLIFSHSLKQTIILTFDKLFINLIEFNHFATDFAKNIS